MARDAKINPKRFYQYVNERRKVRPTIGTLVDNDGNETRNDQEKATLLNEYFASVFTVENPNIPQPPNPPAEEELSDIEFHESEVEAYLKS